MAILVRKARMDELEIVASILWEEVYSELDYAYVRKWIEESGWPFSAYNFWFVLAVDGKIAGVICWNIFDRYGSKVILNVAWMAIAGEYQGKGYGTALWKHSLEQVIQYLANLEEKVALIMVQVDEENNKARSFFRKVLAQPIEVIIHNVWGENNGVVFLFMPLS
jgi:GNAT superfamily N-acetyltransferase